jgi:histidine triad (HIT) family protein
MATADSIFTKIFRGQIPCQKVFENERVFAFLDINPLAVGHTLVVPKTQVERLEDLPAEDAAELGRCLGRLGSAIVRATGASGFNVLQNNGAVAGQVVPHVHFHIIPRRDGDGLGFRWNAHSARAEELAATAGRIAASLG